jgi:hypothetical protein
MTGFGVERQILVIEIYEVDVFEAKLGRLSATQIPDCLCDAAGDEPTVRQGNLLEPFKDLREPPILPKCGFEIVEQGLSHDPQSTPPSSSVSCLPVRTPRGYPQGVWPASQKRFWPAAAIRVLEA